MSSYLYCATERGIEEHIRDGESCRICKDWIKAGKPVTTPTGRIEPPKKKKNPNKVRRVEETNRTRRAEAQCGTRSGYSRHYDRNEEACRPCKDAQAEYGREQRRKRGIKPLSLNEREHGTPRGFRQHIGRKEEPCQPCRDAINKQRREERAAKRIAKGLKPMTHEYGERVHGNRTGAQQHRRAGEPLCEECKVGERAEKNAQRAASRARRAAA